MLAESSNRTAEDLKAVKAAVAQADVLWKARLVMLGLNFIPLVHIATTVLLCVLPYASFPARIGSALAFLYLAPPLFARLILFAAAIPQGRISIGTKPFFIWWLVFQLQIVFCRLPVLEEVLRLIPGLYSQWLRLWGARIGRLTYWSPGTLITDRSFLSIGDDVVLAAGVRLNPHVLAKGKEGGAELLLANVRIGDRAMVGGYSLLTAGTEIPADEFTRAFLISPPFSAWKEGKRVRRQNSAEFE
jgi:acetyltransferase-like isoleucine patch superfamily enzyme